MRAVAEEKLGEIEVEFSSGAACCVVMASNGYPSKYETGFEINVPEGIDAEVFVAGAKLSDGKLLTAGGRVLGVVKTADTLENAIDGAYAAASEVSFENAFFRKDIGKRALAALKN